ncbi:MerR family transcriptional regulator [Actinomadura algeriensis]|uniref:DNA-binding transcriptional MerR regulator n=1 Tax=Actinomadura algeriensis TaxID=1679523 RepID=A0ABR9K2T4_9ACTN|nr:MerR family transcriptional regulator [Actinomadura algeriensis]MBE1537174.1 DNA-binding transcriptional MerR regulator [Actinomadura algeriensis]
MTDATSIAIGDLSALTGVPVRTIRFYCDEGILEPVRSAGGHRRFDAAAAERLRLVRRLRGLGLGLPAITAVLTGDRSLDEAVAAERSALDVELAALAWRRASLRAVEDADPAERAARLDLLAAVQDGPKAHEALLDFWRRRIMVPVPDELVRVHLELTVPAPPADPTPGQVVAYAEMVALTGDRVLVRELRAQGRANAEQVADEPTLLNGMREAVELAMPLVRARREPEPGPALERFMEAHAAGRRERDSPGFRRSLLPAVALEQDPRMRRYWELNGEVAGDAAVPGAVVLWLIDALEGSVALQRA